MSSSSSVRAAGRTPPAGPPPGRGSAGRAGWSPTGSPRRQLAALGVPGGACRIACCSTTRVSSGISPPLSTWRRNSLGGSSPAPGAASAPAPPRRSPRRCAARPAAGSAGRSRRRSIARRSRSVVSSRMPAGRVQLVLNSACPLAAPSPRTWRGRRAAAARPAPALVGHERDADARRDHDRPGPQAERPAETGAQPLGHLRGQRSVGVGEQDAELVPADARDDVLAAHRLLQAGGRQPQQLVAVVVAERVVHRLEVVEVDDEEREAASSGRRASAGRAAR